VVMGAGWGRGDREEEHQGSGNGVKFGRGRKFLRLSGDERVMEGGETCAG
jgi:hypothetical protein